MSHSHIYPFLVQKDPASIHPVMIVRTKEPDSKLSTYVGQILDVLRNLAWIQDLRWPPPER